MRVSLGEPTRYGYSLPLIRYNLCKKYLKKLGKKGLILDYGCGNGANTIFFKNAAKKIIGIDVEQNRVSEAIREAKQREIANIIYKKYNGRKIPFKDQSFDAIISFEVLEHTKNDKHSLKDIWRTLKPNGILCLSVPNKWYLMETHGFNLPLKKIIPWNRIPFLNLMPNVFYLKYGNARIYTKKGVCGLLKDNNFHIISTCYIKPPLDKIKNKRIWGIINTIIQKLPEFMGVSIFVTARRDNENEYIK